MGDDDDEGADEAEGDAADGAEERGERVTGCSGGEVAQVVGKDKRGAAKRRYAHVGERGVGSHPGAAPAWRG